MSAHCHDHACAPAGTHANDPRWRRALWVALVVNAGMFLVEIVGGLSAESASLLADAVDFGADAANYGLSLAVLGLAAVWSSRVAWLKGWAMVVYGAGVLLHAGWLAWQGSQPDAPTMGGIGLAALVANLAVAAMLYRFRKGDANAESVWVCSRNDALANVAIMLAALGVFGTGTAWPDLVVATVIAALGVSGGLRVLRSARHELREHAHA
ncbi:cation transporter [Caldimonas thermodepolymerans]|jgi:Co/Zn/Cd efflux system component|uniref:Cation transporter n=1 Tax=Caldimonas thermodepolymerans TaxID=215580 RepID=A0A2S5T9L1_9BURK|nr:cation transporter [Caldimonas thermodepolymerans]PPE71649.1 cation transporter [Caldimonas thermodepolymerans]QPC30676.1 cation transporter [Caldimonas thermodepolymerans]RDI02715.1 Co/Zn/Cd efflux system component [Caldimonas thermodepolymerans]TCP08755.1 Co/Zn/Cd efflux system component [Caldimonas thermodepolymerans]UZG43411.1 cation transporter [Caldimonas thermodepolymerans]